MKREEGRIGETTRFDLEERLVDFAVSVIRLLEALPKTKTGNHIAGQVVRSGTAPAAIYGEAQGAESRADFIHKIKLALKELRETRVWLLIVDRARLIETPAGLEQLADENNQLISIFVKSIETAKANRRKAP